VADWHWEPVTDDLLDWLPVELVYLTDVRGERVVIIQVNWIG
jgi:hypothetical protein